MNPLPFSLSLFLLSLFLCLSPYTLDSQGDAAWIIKIFGWISYCFGACTLITARFSPLRSTAKLLFTVFSPRNYREIRFGSVTGRRWLFKSIPRHYFRRYLDFGTCTRISRVHVYIYVYIYVQYMYIYVYVYRPI